MYNEWCMRYLRKRSLARSVLRGLGIAGLVLIAASNPYFGLNLIKGFRYRDKKDWAKFYRSLKSLQGRGLVKFIDNGHTGITAQITLKGKETIRQIEIDELQIENKEIDGKWRLVIFDVPVKKNKNRLAFREKIKNMGFIMVQKSVWASPYECYKEIIVLRKFYEIEKYVTYLEASDIEDELIWRGKFNLKNQT